MQRIGEHPSGAGHVWPAYESNATAITSAT